MGLWHGTRRTGHKARKGVGPQSEEQKVAIGTREGTRLVRESVEHKVAIESKGSRKGVRAIEIREGTRSR